MIRKAARQAAIWQKAAVNFGRVVINLSEYQLSEISLIADLQTILLETKCTSQWLEFEIDESVFRSDDPVVYQNLENIAKIGGALTVANFAEDRPILYLFEQLRIEKFKMSKSYTELPANGFVGSAMKDAMFTLARSLGIDVVAGSLGNDLLSSDKVMKASAATFYLRCNKRN
jgi:EAL domain-containing protein (putative c-di-GMP-specific phosphodiesterase class I)